MRLEGLLGREWLGFEGAVALLDEHLHLALGGVEFLLADRGEAHTFFKELEGLLQGQVALLELIDYGFEFLEGLFESGRSDRLRMYTELILTFGPETQGRRTGNASSPAQAC